MASPSLLLLYPPHTHTHTPPMGLFAICFCKRLLNATDSERSKKEREKKKTKKKRTNEQRIVYIGKRFTHGERERERKENKKEEEDH